MKKVLSVLGVIKKDDIIEPTFVISEGISGYYHYHISRSNNVFEGLCGAKTMHTLIPFSYWDNTPKDYHLRESWCQVCHNTMSSKSK